MTTTEASGDSPASDATRASLWRNGAYLLLMTGKTTQLVGNGVATFAVPLIAFAVTGSVGLAGLVSAVSALGLFLATLPAGMVADRVDRRRLIIVCSVIGAALWASLALTYLAGALGGWQLAITLGLASAVQAFYGPAESASIRAVVRTDQLGSAMAAMQGRSAVASLAAAPIGGLLYGLARALPFIADIVGYLVAGVTAVFVRRPLSVERADRRGEGLRGALHDIADGIRYVWSVPFMRLGTVVFAIINLAFEGVVVGVNLHLVAGHTAPLRIALVDVASGVAMLLGSFIAPVLVKRFPAGWLTIVCLMPSAVGGVGMALTNTYLGYVLWGCLMSICIPAVNSALLGYGTAITPAALQGRMSSVLMLSSLLVLPLAPVLAGVMLAGLGVQATLVVFAVLLAVAVFSLLFAKSVRRIGRPDTWEADVVVWES